MTYLDMKNTYYNPDTRGRCDMCATEQAHLTYSSSPDASIKALADAVIVGDTKALDSLYRAVVTSPNGAVLDDDANVTAAVQAVWAVVAVAIYPVV